jgi:alkylation response protein AidB-like acyl-CoA dehydrogenase
MDLLDVVRDNGGVDDPVLRQRLADLYIRSFANRLLQQKVFGAKLHGQPAGAAASVSKALGDDIGQLGLNLAKDLAGPAGMLTDVGPLGTAVRQWHFMYLFSRALTIGGGTAEVQRNIIGERELGLPRDIDVEADRSWSESRTGLV